MIIETKSKNEILNVLKYLKPILSQKYHVLRIGLFGSFAVDNFHENSDIDIIIDFEQPIGWEFFDVQDLLSKHLNRKIDLVSGKALKAQLKDKIMKQVIFV